MRCPGYPYPSLVSGLGFRVPDCVTNVMVCTPLNSRSQMQDFTLHKGLSFDSGLRLQDLGFGVILTKPKNYSATSQAKTQAPQTQAIPIAVLKAYARTDRSS